MLILTGFEPFGKYMVNPSQLLVHALKNELGYDVKLFDVPVSYLKAKDIARKIIGMKPEAVLSFGFAPSSKEIRVEALAINVMHSNTEDNDGFIARKMKIYEDGRDCYFSTAPFYDIAERLNSHGIKARVSFSAGTYVCNTLFYSLLHNAEKNDIRARIGFIHIPPTEQIANSGMKFEDVKKAAMIAIDMIYPSKNQ